MELEHGGTSHSMFNMSKCTPIESNWFAFSFSKHIDQGVTEQCSNSLLDSWDNRPRLPSTFQRVYQESHIHAHTTDFVPATFWVLTKPFFSNREEFNFWAIHLLV